MSELDGRVALVTGGSRGIGAAIARSLAAAGADVAITYASASERAEALTGELRASGRRAVAYEADAARPAAMAEAVERTVADLGRVDVLVNNAGIFPNGPLEAVAAEEVERTLAVHVSAVFLASQAAARHMADGGRIVSIGSCFAERVPYAGVTLYATSKAALVGMTKGLARDLGPRGIAVTVVHPGPTDTDMNPADDDGAEEEGKLTALGRYAAPEEIAATVRYLAGPGGGYVTGTAIAVDGGYAA